MTSQTGTRLRQHPKKKGPALARPFFQHPLFDQPRGGAELPILVLLALLAGLLTLAVRILLLLSGFLPAALLLTRLLSRILVLLAGILVLIGHCDLPFFKVAEAQLRNPLLVARKPGFPAGFRLFGQIVVPTLTS